VHTLVATHSNNGAGKVCTLMWEQSSSGQEFKVLQNLGSVLSQIIKHNSSSSWLNYLSQ